MKKIKKYFTIVQKIKELDLCEKILWFLLIIISLYIFFVMTIGIVESQKKFYRSKKIQENSFTDVPPVDVPTMTGFKLTIYNFDSLMIQTELKELQNAKNKQ